MQMSINKPKVAHFVRKSSQLRASFIQNQIVSHLDYEPVLVWRKQASRLYDGGYAAFDYSVYPALDLSVTQGWVEKALFAGPKVLSRRQVERVARFLESEEVQICHFHYGTDCGIYYPFTRELKIPSVVSFYGYDSSSFPGLLFGYGRAYLQKRVFSNVSAVLAMSPDMKHDLIKAGCPEEKIIVHYYGTDCKRFDMHRQYPEKGHLNLLILASLVPQKGHIFLFKSLLALLQSGVRNWKLEVIGVGESADQIKNFAQKNGLSEFVRFMGGIPYGSAEMMEAYRRADIFVHPSVVAENGDKEGIPGTVIEAMAAGLPVVSTYHAGIPYVISHGKTGLLVQEWDTEELSGAIARLIADPSLRQQLGTAAQTEALQTLELREKEKELEDIYSRLTGVGASIQNAQTSISQ